jgi:SPP1 family predicted phage head-tail adaptor
MPLASRIGSMRETLHLRRNTQTTDTGTGFKTSSWNTFARVAAEYINPPGGRESWQQSAVVSEIRPRFRIRPRTDVEPKQQFLWKGVTYEIHAVIPIQHVGARFLLLEAGRTQ